MRVVTVEEMNRIDTWATRKLGIASGVLMENAGRGCADVLAEYHDLNGLRVLLVCGRGNNGGDGFVCARHLRNRGAIVKIIFLGRRQELKGDALANYRLARTAGLEIQEARRPRDVANAFVSFRPDAIIDAIFGTGFRGKPDGVYARAIDLVNDAESFVLSIDIPSGLCGDDGRFAKKCVIADATAVMCLPKRGNHLFPGKEYCGELHVVDIGIPYALIDDGFPRIIEPDDILQWMPFRAGDGNKGTFGHVLVVAGARGFSGAAAMASQSALRVGAGLVRLAGPRSITDALEARLLEVVKLPLEETASGSIAPQAIATLDEFLQASDVTVIGPGISTHPQTAEFVKAFLDRIASPCVVDADAINIIAQDARILRNTKAPLVLTPHPGELARLIKTTPDAINERRIDTAVECAHEFNCVLVLKGAPTVIADAKGNAFVNPTGNTGLATAGSGDVLTGMIAGFLAQKQSPLHAAATAVFLHGLCADLAMEHSNEYALTAADLIDQVPAAINYLLRRQFAQ